MSEGTPIADELEAEQTAPEEADGPTFADVADEDPDQPAEEAQADDDE